MGSLNPGINDGILLQRAPGLALVLDTPKGRGVFATHDIPAKTVIDICPVIVLRVDENESYIRHTKLFHYTYNWPYRDNLTSKIITTQAIVLGLGSMFNHSRVSQNVGWERDVENQLVRYTALCNIERGQELCISYGSKLTFEDTEQELLPFGLTLIFSESSNDNKCHQGKGHTPASLKDVISPTQPEMSASPSARRPTYVRQPLLIVFKIHPHHPVNTIQASDWVVFESERHLCRMPSPQAGPPAFDRCSMEQKLVLLALKTQYTFKETAEIWSSRYYKCSAKYLSRGYKNLRRQDKPAQLYFTRDELERLQIIASPDDWMPDEHVIYMLLIWQSGTTCRWQWVEKSFNRRFYTNLSIHVLAGFALRYLHDKKADDYMVRNPRPQTLRLTNDDAFLLSLELAARPITTWSMDWLGPTVFGPRKPPRMEESSWSSGTSSTTLQTALEGETQTQVKVRGSMKPPRSLSRAQTLLGDRAQTQDMVKEDPIDLLEPLPIAPVLPSEKAQTQTTVNGKTLPTRGSPSTTTTPIATLLLPLTTPPPEKVIYNPTAPGLMIPALLPSSPPLGSPINQRAANCNPHYPSSPESLQASKARLKGRLGLFLCVLYDYTDLVWEEIVRVCPLGPNWNWIKDDGGAFGSWEECLRAMAEVMAGCEMGFPVEEGDGMWIAAFLGAHARGREMWPGGNPRGE
ncbi:hypothetical protein FGG08_001153 [Glutinoglossum americanum]|uniref:SET domain-containing protein n=1 Tax=Glutinoglossum americanum TaxID=1670608 RepID=A0A9P8L0G5_9PEZI|nr:hypothetical protein FGG08_001153 [Glutinoglossum americanum]